ncbi:MAG: DUF1302 family protein [Azonexus sp.]
MKQKHDQGCISSGQARKVLLALAAIAICPALHASDDSFKVDGYLREELSVNTKNWADTPNYDDSGKLSMARTTLRLNVDWKATENISIVAKLRGSLEAQTPFLKHLEEMGANNYGSGGGSSRGNIMDLYNKADIRELYIDWQASDRIKFRFGRQQIVWGETDFFAANDMVHGFNLTWRSFLEPANEELRKPLIMLKTNIDIPEADGAIEAFVRPGWDRRSDIGTELDIYGGRWSSQPYAGVDFRNIDPYNLDSSEGDYKKVTGGIRWNGTADKFNYSASYLKTFWQSPILNASSTDFAGGAYYVPTTLGASNIKSQQGAVFGEIIYPIVDVFGATASGYADWADAVFSAEVAYIKDAPYQFNNYPANSLASTIVAPGFDGIKKKNLIAWMLRMDKNIAATQSLLGSEKPMFFSVQLFDKWVQDFNERDGLLNSVGWGARTKEHSLLLTGIFSLSYDNGRIKPELVVGSDLTYKGGFFAPSVTVELSKNLKWKTEYDGFWDGGRWRDTGPGSACASAGANQSNCDSAGLFGYFHNRDQLYTSLTYQF